MRELALGLAILLMPLAASAADIGATCYTACEAQTSSNLEYKACLARAADAADAKLNEAYGALKAAIRRWAAELGQRPDEKLQSLVGAQKKWIAYRDANCTFEDELAFGGTAIGGNYSACLCALSLRPHHQAFDPDRLEIIWKMGLPQGRTPLETPEKARILRLETHDLV